MNLIRLLLFMAPAVLSLCARAQEGSGYFDGSRSFYGGLIGGMNVAQVDGDTYGGYHKVGLNFGGIVYASFIPEAGISLELLFSQKGSKGVRTSESSVGSFYEKYTLAINYAEVPLIVHFYSTPRIHVGAGASYSQYISSKENYEGLYAKTIFDPELYKFKKYEVDMIFSISYMLYKGLMGDARFQYSLTPVRDGYYAPPDFSNNGGRQMNNMFAFRLAYLF